MYTILIADDEKEEQEGVAFLLDELGYLFEKAFAANGRIALNYLNEHPVDILFTDVRMPIMDGLTLAKEARTRFPKLKIIIFSGYSEFEYARTAIQIGVASYILKPVNVDEFRKTMDEAIAQIAESQKESQKLLRQEAYARKHLLFRLITLPPSPLSETISEGNESPNGFETYRRMFLLEFENGFFDMEGLDFEQEILAQFPLEAEYLNLNMCQSLLLFQEERDTDFYLKMAGALFQWLTQTWGNRCYIAVSPDFFPCKSLSGIFRDLEEMMEYRFFLPNTHIFSRERILDEFLLEAPAENQVLEQIKKDIGAKDFSALTMHLDLLCSKYERNPSFSQLYVKFIFSSLYRDLVTELDGEAASEQHLNYTIDRLYRSMDIHEIIRLLKDTVTSLESSWSGTLNGASRDVDIVKAYIDSHYAEDLDLSVLAEQVFLSPRYLSTLFKRVTGCGINRYIKTVRMEKARELLEETSIKVVDLCEAVGFHNLSYFCQNFREFYGETPEKYRNSDYYHNRSNNT